jgi:hypothetical protein
MIVPLVTDGEGVSTEIFLFAVGGLASTVAGMAAVIHKLYRANNADDRAEIVDLKKQCAAKDAELSALRQENAEQKERLYLYSLIAPDIVTQVRIMLKTISPSPTSNDSTVLPFPYERSRRSRPRRPRIGGQP